MATSIYIYDKYSTYVNTYHSSLIKTEDYHNEVLELFVRPKISLFVVTKYNNRSVPRPMLNHTIVHFMSGTIDPHDDPTLYAKNESPIRMYSDNIKINSVTKYMMFVVKQHLFFKKVILTLHIDKILGNIPNKPEVFAVLYDKIRDRLNFICSPI